MWDNVYGWIYQLLTPFPMFTRTKLPPHVPKTQEDIYNDALQAWIFRLYII